MIWNWKLNGEARDDSGEARNCVVRGAEFLPGGGARFDGRSWIEISDPPGPDLAEFTLSLWADLPEHLPDIPGDLVSRFDAESRWGWVLGFTDAAGVTSSQPHRRHLSFSVSAGDPPRIHHAGGPRGAMLIFALATHAGRLYAATCEPGPRQAGRVYRFSQRGGGGWTRVGTPDLCNAVSSLAVYRGSLFAGTAKYRLAGSALPESTNPNMGGGVFRYVRDGEWETCGRLPGVEAIGGMVVFQDRLYASSLYKPAGFFRYEGGADWVACTTPGEKRVEALCVFEDSIYASGYDEGHIYRYDGEHWEDCGPLGENTQTYSFAIYDGCLYAGTWPSGCVYRREANGSWTNTGRLGEELEVMAMMVHNGKLFAGTLPSAEVYRFDGDDQWTRVCRLDHTPDVRYRRVWSMAAFQGGLYCGTLPSGQVHRLEAGVNVTLDRELPPGIHHLAAVQNQGLLSLYVDGKRVAESRRSVLLWDDPSRPNVPLLIGGGPQKPFTGRIWDVQMADRAISQRHVKLLYEDRPRQVR